MDEEKRTALYNELVFKATRSQGPGGQNVNKVNTRIELRFNIASSLALTNREKELLTRFFGIRISESGELILVSQSSRSQLANKEDAVKRFFQLVGKGLIPPKRRKATRPTKASVARRLEQKRQRSETKSLRNLKHDQ